MLDPEIFPYLVCLKTIYNWIRVISVKIWRSSNNISTQLSSESEPLTKVILIFPLLHEGELIENLVNVTSRLLNEAPHQVEVVFACSGREHDKGLLSTANMLRSFIKQSNLHRYIYETDGSDHCKADQLNFALQQHLKSSFFAPQSTWIGIYDADSSPEPGTIQELLARIQDRKECVYQQAPLYTNSWEKLKKPKALINDLFCLSRSLYSHVFSYKESFGFLCSESFFDIRLHHFTGHGYFIRLDTLKRFGWFDPPSCDTTLGYKLSFGGVKFRLLQTRDISEVPHKASLIIKQGVVWFNGCEMYLREYQRMKAHIPKYPLDFQNKLKIVQVFFTNLSWSTLPWLWTIIFIFSLHSHLYLWIAAACSWLSLRVFLWIEMIYMSKKTLYDMGWLRLILPPLFSPISVLIGCLAPISYYYQRYIKRRVNLVKTPR